MKKAILVLSSILVAVFVLLPVGVILSACFGYTFELANYSVFAIITALMAIIIVVFYVLVKTPIENKALAVLLSLIAPLSLANASLYMFECRSIWAIASMFICVCCCCYLTVRYGKPLALKIISLVLSALMVVWIGFCAFVTLIFGNFGQNAVVKSIESPNGTYYAEIIDSDQGALGGDTFVDVYENKGINLIIFKISKNPQTVYIGEWGEFENMEIYWRDEKCLVINSVEYIVR